MDPTRDKVKVTSRLRPNNFDLIRLLAAMQVVISHGIRHLELGDMNWFGLKTLLSCFPGVPIFFVISGFLVSASFERSKSTKAYFVNRALRIFPALWVCFGIGVLSVLVLKPDAIMNASKSELTSWVFAQLTMFQTFNPDFLRDYGAGVLNGSLWTIPVELEFYFVIPFLYLVFRNSSRKTTLICLSGLVVLFMVVNQVFNYGFGSSSKTIWYKLFKYSMFPYLWLFIVGIVAQQNFDKIRPIFEGKIFYWLVVHFVAVFVTFKIGLPFGSNHPFPLCGLSLAGLTLASAFSFREISNKLLRHNDISYGIYIYHMIVANALIHLNMTGKLSHLLLLLVITLSVSYLSWLVVEAPCMKLKKRFHKPAQ